jgi:hypothetical protein
LAGPCPKWAVVASDNFKVLLSQLKIKIKIKLWLTAPKGATPVN